VNLAREDARRGRRIERLTQLYYATSPTAIDGRDYLCTLGARPRRSATRPSADSTSTMPVGVCVVTGFLGSGKTTLVNYVLKADHGFRIAVVLNDFGAELGVEKMLVQQDGVDGDNAGRTLVEDWVELNNGCVCCTVKGTLVQTIEGLLEKRREMGEKFDFILLETTGLADPGPVAQELWVDDELVEEDGAVLDSIVTLVDASNIERQLEENAEATLQVAYADTILLNKADLVKEEDLERIKRRIEAINAEAEEVVTTRSCVDLGIVLNQGTVAAGGRGRKPVLSSFAAAPSSVITSGGGFWAKGVEKYAPASVHDTSIRTVCVAVPGYLDARLFEDWLEDLLWERRKEDGGVDILRAKGLVYTAGSRNRRVLQAVREVYEITDGPVETNPENVMNKFVFIGRNLDERAMTAALQRCVT